jgi:uncharacterized membrane protein HdeD (DUF308 family)
VASVLEVFGRWAIVSGVAQRVAALHLCRPAEMGKQWSLQLAGALSVIAGVGFVGTVFGTIRAWTLVMYAAAGGAFFLIQDALLYWRLRNR